MNDLFKRYGMPQSNPLNNMNQMMKQFNEFKKTFSGDPQQIVMNMVNSGRISQQQFDYAKNMANMLQGFMKH